MVSHVIIFARINPVMTGECFENRPLITFFCFFARKFYTMLRDQQPLHKLPIIILEVLIVGLRYNRSLMVRVSTSYN